jgi:hypothetical protein
MWLLTSAAASSLQHTQLLEKNVKKARAHSLLVA